MSATTRSTWEPSSSGGKIDGRHLERSAVVYVRQSTMQQVERHQESTRVQYGLVDRAIQLGWPPQRVQVIDDDLGVSGASAEGRPGFQRLVAEVGLDHVGIVLGVEMSRLARSCRDWYQLLEVCAVFGTLIGDLDGVYDPAVYNDRLLLGLKGTMSEAELHVIKQRMLHGKLAKARRGELGMSLPMGYLKEPSGEISKDPDEQARSTIEFVFELFERHGTINAVLRQLVDRGISMPNRVRTGPSKGQLEWSRPNRMTLSNLLHNPIYAGAYAYGRRQVDARRKKPGRRSTGRVVAKPFEWEVLLRDRLPAYISWEQYERNVRRMEANRASMLGVVRNGPSLLSGLVICGRCGLRMAATYQNNGKELRYSCDRMSIDYGEPRCQSLKGEPLDRLVGSLVLDALQPAALELSLKVAEDVEGERRRSHEQWRLRLERARYETDRAFRQYDAVEPENRLVVRGLERRWEEKLAAEETLKQEYARFCSTEPPTLSAADREAIRQLAADVPALWHAPTTTPADRQEIIRQMVERVIVTVKGETEVADVQIHWAGGHRTKAELLRPVARLDQLSYYPELMERVRQLHAEGCRATAIAERLNDEGWRPPKRRDTFNSAMTGELLSRLGLRVNHRRAARENVKLPRGSWFLADLARHLGMPDITLYNWLTKGLVTGRRLSDRPGSPWIIEADKAELKRLRELRQAPRRRPHFKPRDEKVLAH